MFNHPLTPQKLFSIVKDSIFILSKREKKEILEYANLQQRRITVLKNENSATDNFSSNLIFLQPLMFTEKE